MALSNYDRPAGEDRFVRTDRVLGICFGALRGVDHRYPVLLSRLPLPGWRRVMTGMSQFIPIYPVIDGFEYLQSSSSFLPKYRLWVVAERGKDVCAALSVSPVLCHNQSIYDALTVLQHRGQDAAGIITIDANNCFRLRKANGLVSDVFEARHMHVCRAIWVLATCVILRRRSSAPRRSRFTLTAVWHHIGA